MAAICLGVSKEAMAWYVSPDARPYFIFQTILLNSVRYESLLLSRLTEEVNLTPPFELLGFPRGKGVTTKMNYGQLNELI